MSSGEGGFTVRSFQVVQCLRCKHIWDDLDGEDFVCSCFDDYGERQVVVLSEGATNTPKTLTLRPA